MCFENGGPLRTLGLEEASACQKTPALQATKSSLLLVLLHVYFLCKLKGHCHELRMLEFVCSRAHRKF